MISSDFVSVIDCAGSTVSAKAANRSPKGGPGGADEDAGLAGGDNFSYPFDGGLIRMSFVLCS